MIEIIVSGQPVEGFCNQPRGRRQPRRGLAAAGDQIYARRFFVELLRSAPCVSNVSGFTEKFVAAQLESAGILVYRNYCSLFAGLHDDPAAKNTLAYGNLGKTGI